MNRSFLPWHPRILAVIATVLLTFAMPGGVTAQQPQFVRVFFELPAPLSAADRLVVEQAGGHVRHTYRTSASLSAEVPAAALPALQSDPRFLRVYPVPAIRAMEDRLDWGVDRIDAERVWGGLEDAKNTQAVTNAGQNIKVAVIDSGFDRDHPDLAANIGGGYNFTTTCDTCWDDDNGHGTHVGGTIAAPDNGLGAIGVAPKARVYGLKVLDASNVGFMDDAAAAVEWASGFNGGTRADVINMSFGCANCDYAPFRSAIDAAFAQGIVLVGAAGNSGPGADTVIYPAKYENVIAVSATTSSDALGSFSSTGPAVDLAAPGASIYSTVPNNTYATFNGTSMASPHVAGVAALVKAANPSWTAQQIRDRLISTATDLGSAGRDNSFGHGLVNALAAAGQLPPGSEPPVATLLHDMAVTSMTATPASLVSGNSTTISVAVHNQGNHAESDVTLTVRDGAAGPIIGTKPVSVAAGASATHNFVWNTTGAATGTHSVFATLSAHLGEVDLLDNTRSINVTVTPKPVSTSFLNCTANAAVRTSSGDNNGYEVNPGSACADDAAFASDNNSGTSTSTSCASTAKDRHILYGYASPVPSGAAVNGIEVRLDAWADAASGTRRLCVELSWNGGASWTAARTTPNLASSQASYIAGSASDLWGRTWTVSELSNLRVRVTDVGSSTSRDFRLDYVGVRLTYTP